LNGQVKLKRAFTKWRNLIDEEAIAKTTRINSALHLILKPLMRNQDRKQKQRGFKAFQRRV